METSPPEELSTDRWGGKKPETSGVVKHLDQAAPEGSSNDFSVIEANSFALTDDGGAASEECPEKS